MCLLRSQEAGGSGSSGYGGEGPRGLSHAIALLREFNVRIDEVVVDGDVFDRLERAGLNASDIELLSTRRSNRGSVYDYLMESHLTAHRDRLWDRAEVAIPFPILHPRVRDLAMSFWSNPDAAILTAFRRLEDAVRERTGLNEHGKRLMSRAFLGDSPPMVWPDLPAGEIQGRAGRFTSAIATYRNPRAHREPGRSHRAEQLRELLAVNELYLLLDQASNAADHETDE